MSWNANRFGTHQVRFQSRRPLAKNPSRGKMATAHRTNDQQMIMRLVMEMNEVVKGGALESIFGSSSAAYALQVALRVKRIKGRDADLPLLGRIAPTDDTDVHLAFRRRFRGRNIHHMTPKCRKGQLFSGNTIRNLLLIKVFRHDLLHKEFGIRTWEEIIALLSRCVEIVCGINFDLMIDRLVPAPIRERPCRHKARHSIYDFQFSESPG